MKLGSIKAIEYQHKKLKSVIDGADTVYVSVPNIPFYPLQP